MRTGVPVDGREMGHEMISASKYRFTRFTDDEVDALHAYFRSMLNFPVEIGS